MLDMGGYGTGARYLLEIAVRHDDAALATWLLTHGANPDSPPPRDPRSPKISLYEAAVRHAHMSVAELLVRYGATTAGTPPGPEGEEAFVAACLRLDRDHVRAMAERHPEYLKSAKAIIAAAEKDRAEVVAFLLDLGVPIEVANEQQQRPLHAAAWGNALRAAELLIERGAEIDPREAEWGNTPLDFAVHFQYRPMIDLLGRHSRDIWNLVFTGRLDRMRELLRENPELAKTVTKENDTPLMWLPEDEEIAAAMVELFLEAGADAGLRSRNGLTAADYASRRGLEEAAALLRAREAGG
jgi:ankyrin repeat protein